MTACFTAHGFLWDGPPPDRGGPRPTNATLPSAPAVKPLPHVVGLGLLFRRQHGVDLLERVGPDGSQLRHYRRLRLGDLIGLSVVTGLYGVGQRLTALLHLLAQRRCLLPG